VAAPDIMLAAIEDMRFAAGSRVPRSNSLGVVYDSGWGSRRVKLGRSHLRAQVLVVRGKTRRMLDRHPSQLTRSRKLWRGCTAASCHIFDARFT